MKVTFYVVHSFIKQIFIEPLEYTRNIVICTLIDTEEIML